MRFGGGEYFSYFELYFYDKNGKEIPVSYIPPSFGIPFMNPLDTPEVGLLIKPKDSLTFKYPIEYLFGLCKEPDKIKKMKLKFHIKYAAFKDDVIVKECVYEEFSKTINIKYDKKRRKAYNVDNPVCNAGLRIYTAHTQRRMVLNYYVVPDGREQHLLTSSCASLARGYQHIRPTVLLLKSNHTKAYF